MNVVTKTAAAAAVWVGHVTSKLTAVSLNVRLLSCTVITSDYDPSKMFTFLRISFTLGVTNT